MSNEALELINKARSQARSDAIWNFVSKNLKIILRILFGLMVVAVIFIGYNIYQKSSKEKFSAMLHQSLVNQQIGEMEKAKKELKNIVESSSAPSGVKSIASLRYAAFLLEDGKKSEAEKIYAEVNNCRSCDEYVSDLAGLLLVKLWVLDGEEMQKSDLISRIIKIENKATVLKNNIAEERALLEFYKKNLAESYKIFEKIYQDQEASQAVKSRAQNGMRMVIAGGFEVNSNVKSEEKSELEKAKTAE